MKVSSNYVTATLSINIPGAHSDKDVIEDDEGQGAAILSLKSHVKLMPDELSNITSPGKLRSRHPTTNKQTINLTVQWKIQS